MDRPPLRLPDRARRWLDTGLVGALLVVGVLGHLAAGQPLEALVTAAEVTPLLWRRTHPLAVFAAVAGISALQAVVVPLPVVGQIAFPIAVYSVARWCPRWQGALALLVGYAGALVATARWLSAFGSWDWNGVAAYVVTIGAIVTAAWALGFAGRQREQYVASLVARAEQAERMAEREVELAARDERARIAREMHDVVAHGLSVIVVQADGARYASEQDPALATKALGTIGETGRESLTEMRRLLGLLRAGDTGVRPQPGLADLATLVDEARVAGTEVIATLPDPVPEVAEGVGLAAYRILQEALTNVRKHAGPEATVRLEVVVDHHELGLEIRDDGRGAAAASDGRGLGLVGIRERAAAHGGTVETGPAGGGGWVVSARLPR